jgi:23S rRNA G2069 N7-methylase RlmK/C1962 C5-methylase RlmI
MFEMKEGTAIIKPKVAEERHDRNCVSNRTLQELGWITAVKGNRNSPRNSDFARNKVELIVDVYGVVVSSENSRRIYWEDSQSHESVLEEQLGQRKSVRVWRKNRRRRTVHKREEAQGREQARIEEACIER